MNRFSDEWAVLATVDPASIAVGTAMTDVIDTQNWNELAFILQLGAIGASGTVDFVVEASAAANMASPVTIRSAAQLTKADSDDNKQVIIGVRNNELSASGRRYIRGKVTVGVAATLLGVIAVGRGTYRPASGSDLSSVDEIKNTGA
jgi:hypothetical protein